MERFIEIIKTIIYGIVEGISEWLPISSTGHMILLREIMPLDVSDAFWDFFLVAIQLGAIFAVIILFFSKLNPIRFKREEGETLLKKDVLIIWAKVLIACLPAAVIGLIFDDKLDEIFYNFTSVSIVLIVYGVLFIILEIWNKKRSFKYETVADITFNMAILIGLIQLLALIPGTSRSGATILGAMLLGCSRTASAEFSFYLSIPVMLGASLFKGVKFFINCGFPTSDEIIILLIGMIIAFIVSMVCIKALMSFIKKHDFKVFGYYRIVLGVILILYFVLR